MCVRENVVMSEGETIVCERVVCEEIVKQLCMSVNELCVRKLRVKELCVKELRVQKFYVCVCEKAGLPSDTVESRTGRPEIIRMRTDRPVPLCVPSKAH